MTHGITHANGSTPVMNNQGMPLNAEMGQQLIEIINMISKGIWVVLGFIRKTTAKMIRDNEAKMALETPDKITIII